MSEHFYLVTCRVDPPVLGNTRMGSGAIAEDEDGAIEEARDKFAQFGSEVVEVLDVEHKGAI